jgi:hypothetical protein
MLRNWRLDHGHLFGGMKYEVPWNHSFWEHDRCVGTRCALAFAWGWDRGSRCGRCRHCGISHLAPGLHRTICPPLLHFPAERIEAITPMRNEYNYKTIR